MKRIWVIEVRYRVGDDMSWSATGEEWYLTKKAALPELRRLRDYSGLTFLYRATQYVPKSKAKGD